LEDRGDRVLVALRNGLLEVDVAAETTTPRALHGFDLGDRRFNDGRCDAKGRVWLGMMDRQIVRPIGGILCLDAFGVEETAGDVVLSNGLCFSPDCRTLYMADTRAGRVFAFDLGERGLSNRRILLQVETGDGSPDGCTVDSEGCLWIALVNGSALIRVSPQGQVLRRVELPVTKPTSCAFGGPGLATLYVTSARHRLATPGPLDGVVLALRDLRVHGLPEHPAKLSLPGI
jgi:sugar lactone lactonase YvrE